MHHSASMSLSSHQRLFKTNKCSKALHCRPLVGESPVTGGSPHINVERVFMLYHHYDSKIFYQQLKLCYILLFHYFCCFIIILLLLYYHIDPYLSSELLSRVTDIYIFLTGNSCYICLVSNCFIIYDCPLLSLAVCNPKFSPYKIYTIFHTWMKKWGAKYKHIHSNT